MKSRLRLPGIFPCRSIHSFMEEEDYMKKLVSLLLCLCLLLGLSAVAEGGARTGSAQGFASQVGVEFTVEIGRAHV